MGWQVYRPGEGRWARLGALAVILGAGAFSAYRWFRWAGDWNWLPFMGRLPMIGRHQLNWGEMGAAVIVTAFALIGYRIGFVRPGSTDFLIEMEIELRKVTWPKWKPLFRPDTELWASTYVVIVVVAALTLFVGLVDLVLTQGADWAFLRP